MVYMAEHPALAALETRVHFDLPFGLLPDDHVLIRVGLRDEPPGRRSRPSRPTRGLQATDGSARAARRCCGCPQLSSIVPMATNLLLTPPRATDAKASLTRPFQFEGRPQRGLQPGPSRSPDLGLRARLAAKCPEPDARDSTDSVPPIMLLLG